MAISYVGGQTGGRAGSTSTSSVTYALTGGTNTTPQANDFVIITIVVATQGRNPNLAITTPTGFAPLFGGNVAQTTTTYNTITNVLYKRMGGTPDTTFTLPSTGNVADAQRYTVQVFRGVDTTYPFGNAIGNFYSWDQGGGSGRPNPPSLDLALAPANGWFLAIGGGAAATGAAYVAPANFTTNFLTGTTADTNDAMIGAGYYTTPGNGVVDPAGFTGGTTNAADSWVGFSIFLAPAATATIHTAGVTEAASSSHSNNGAVGLLINETGTVTDTSSVESTAPARHRVFFISGTSGIALRPVDEVSYVVYANIGENKARGYGTGGTTHGYAGGGGLSGTLATNLVTKFVYADEAVRPNSATLAVARTQLAGVSSSTKGYYAGGITTSNANSSEVDAVVFATDTASNPSSTLGTATKNNCGVESSSDGYFCGGYTTVRVTAVDRLSFGTETITANGTSLGTAREYSNAVSSDTKGYILGGWSNASEFSAASDGITFSTNTVSSLGNLTYGTYERSGRSDTHGWSSGGMKLTFSSDTVSSISLVSNQTQGVALTGWISGNYLVSQSRTSTTDEMASESAAPVSRSESGSAVDVHYSEPTSGVGTGYWYGGTNSTGSSSVIDKFVFSTETASAAAYSAPVATTKSHGFSGKFSGYVAGGSTNLATVYKFLFGLEASVFAGAALTTGRDRAAGAASSTHGYTMGGYKPGSPPWLAHEKLAFANDTTSVISGSSSNAYNTASPYSSSAAYLALGKGDTTDRFMLGSEVLAFYFSSDTYGSVYSMTLTSREQVASIQSSTKGYWVGGSDSGSVLSTEIDGILFSNNTMVQPTAVLSAGRSMLAGVWSTTTGYTGGGKTSGTDYSTEIESFVFSSETSANPSATLTEGRNSASGLSAGAFTKHLPNITEAASSSATHDSPGNPAMYPWHKEQASASADHQTTHTTYGTGVFFGGFTGTSTESAVIDLTNFYNDAMSTAANISGGGIESAGGASFETSGLFVGGLRGGYPIDAIFAYAYDSQVAVEQTETLTSERVRCGSVQSDAKGYFAGGMDYFGTLLSSVNYVVNATRVTGATTGSLGATRRYLSGVSSSTKGYFCGGEDSSPSAVAAIDYVTFSNDTMSTLGSSLPADKRMAGGVSGSSVGFVAGGVDDVGLVLSVHKITFSGETVTTHSSSLATYKQGPIAVSSSPSGYFSGGRENATDHTSSTEKIAFSSGTISAGSGALSVARSFGAGCARKGTASSAINDSVTEALSATAAHDSTGSQSISGSAVESAAASDAPYVVQVTFSAMTEAAYAAAEAVAERVQHAAQTDSAAATDSTTSTITFFLSHDAGANAFDLSSVQSVFVAHFDAPVVAIDTPSARADFIVAIQEAAAAAAESARWLAGSGFVKKITAFVATAGGRTVCYLKPSGASVSTKKHASILVERREVQRVVAELSEQKALTLKKDA